MSDFHVLIAGGGIGGLCLAQGLTKAGIACTVYESTTGIVQAGYRLHMNASGGEALKATLPENLYELYLQVSRRTPRRELFVVLDRHGNELGTRAHIGPPNDGTRPHTAMNRRTLRQILATGLGSRLEFGRTVTGYTLEQDNVRLQFADGSTAVGDVLVGADGIHSRVRRQYLPDLEVHDVGRTGVWSTAALTDDLAEILPPAAFDGFIVVDWGNGMISALGVYDPRRPISEAVAELAPGAEIDHVEPYVMFTYGNGLGSTLAPGTLDFSSSSPEETKAYLQSLMVDVHPGFAEIVDRLDLATIGPNNVRHLDVAEPWEPTRVTLLGDAIHAMPPSFGAGANSALRDAAALTRAIEDIAAGSRGIADAIGEYEREMRDEVFPIMRASADPDVANDVRRSTHPTR